MASNKEAAELHSVSHDEECQNCGIKILSRVVSPKANIHIPGRRENWTAGDENKQRSPNLTEMLGINELFYPDVWQASVGELLGTAVLVFMINTISISILESDIATPNLVLSVLAAIIITILLLAVQPISGGHINPIVSFSAALVGIVSMTRAIIYILAQCLGAILATLALKAVVSDIIEQEYSLGGCTISIIQQGPITTGLDVGRAFLLEIICSFIFLFASLWMAYDDRQMKELGRVIVFSNIGTVVGLLVFVSNTVTAQKGYSGVGLNPARCLGPAVVVGGHLWKDHWVFWAGPVIGCVGFYLYTRIIPSEHHRPKKYDHDFCKVIKVMVGARRPRLRL